MSVFNELKTITYIYKDNYSSPSASFLTLLRQLLVSKLVKLSWNSPLGSNTYLDRPMYYKYKILSPWKLLNFGIYEYISLLPSTKFWQTLSIQNFFSINFKFSISFFVLEILLVLAKYSATWCANFFVRNLRNWRKNIYFRHGKSCRHARMAWVYFLRKLWSILDKQHFYNLNVHYFSLWSTNAHLFS